MAGARLNLTLLLFALLLAGCTLAGCTNVRPVAKIGLIAPFEGLYRRSGYAALAAMRAAIDDAGQGDAVNVLPLALDDSGDPAQARRALEKLLVSSDVGAIVGPLAPAQAAAIADLSAPTTPPLLAPFALPGLDGEGSPDPTAWAPPLVQTVGTLAAAQGAQALVLAGWTPGWPEYTTAEWSTIAGLPVQRSDDPAAVAGDAAVMWLGAPDGGATYLAALRERQPDVAFWLGPAGDDPVFADHARTQARVYWVVWVDDGYNSWAAAHTPSTPSAYLIYRATQAALRELDGRDGAMLTPPTWRVQAYTFGPGGEPSPYAPAP